jgi:putative heme-binding domain-containing protein
VLAALYDPANAGDRWIPDAATCAAARNSEHFLRALAGSSSPSAKLLAVAGVVAEHYARGGPVESVGAVLGRLLEAHPQTAETVVRGLAKGWPVKQSPHLDLKLEQDLERLSYRLPPERRGLVVKLAIAWGSKKFEKHAAEVARLLLARVQNEAIETEERIAAARELLGHRASAADTVKTLLDLVTPRTPPALAIGILGALQVSEAPEAGGLILEHLPGLTPRARAAGLGVLLARPEWTRALLRSADQGKITLAELSLDQKQTLAEYPDRFISRWARKLLERKGALPNADRQKVLQELLPLARQTGDAAAGKVVFKNHCAKCHVHGSEGNRIGPDLTGMAVHPKEHLLADIIDPSRNVEANFRSYLVATRKGLVLTGLLASESATAIELFDAEGKKQTVLREDIAELVASSKSLMPDGFEKQLNPRELTDLLEFLRQRGKYLPLPLAKVATAVSTRGMFYSETARGERLVLGNWSPKTANGIPFHLVDPQGDRVPNVILFHSPQGKVPPKMPKAVSLPCNAPAKALHFLSGVSGWGYPYSEKGTVSLIVRLHYEDGRAEDHPLKNGVHFADYIRRVDVPGSEFAFALGSKQIRHLTVRPQRLDKIATIELVKGPDDTAPIVMAVTVEAPE